MDFITYAYWAAMVVLRGKLRVRGLAAQIRCATPGGKRVGSIAAVG
jgi:hypothetical protein